MKLVAAIYLLEVKVAHLFGLATFWLDCNITAGDTQLNAQAWLRNFHDSTHKVGGGKLLFGSGMRWREAITQRIRWKVAMLRVGRELK